MAGLVPVRRYLLMGTSARRRPRQLAKKLLEIRRAFGDSQNSLLRRLGLTDEVTQSDISAFERGTREPPLPVLLKYAQTAGVWIDVLVDDDLDLPKKLPASPKSEGTRRKSLVVKKRLLGRKGG
jgi:transcriptional regulator with XRE-family HTH domain